MVHFFLAGLNEKYKNCCMHCLIDSNGALNKMRWCYQGTHKALHHDFVFNNQNYFKCNEYFKCKNVTLSAMETFDKKFVLADHWKLIDKFNSKLNKLEHLICNIWNKIGFNMEMKKVDDINKCKQFRLERDKSEK